MRPQKCVCAFLPPRLFILKPQIGYMHYLPPNEKFFQANNPLLSKYSTSLNELQLITNYMKFIRFILLGAILNVSSNTWAQKIGLLMDSYVIDRWYIDQKLFTDKVKALGGECLVEMPYGDPDEQVKLGKKLISMGVDALVIIPTDGKRAAEIVEAAKAANIPVIAYDRMINSSDLSLYISYDNLKVGKLQAEY